MNTQKKPLLFIHFKNCSGRMWSVAMKWDIKSLVHIQKEAPIFSIHSFFHPLTARRYACQSQSVVVRYSVQWANLISSKRFPRDQNVCFHHVFLFTLTFPQGSYRKFDSKFKDTIGRPKFKEGDTNLICTHKLKNREISFLLAAISCS